MSVPVRLYGYLSRGAEWRGRRSHTKKRAHGSSAIGSFAIPVAEKCASCPIKSENWVSWARIVTHASHYSTWQCRYFERVATIGLHQPVRHLTALLAGLAGETCLDGEIKRTIGARQIVRVTNTARLAGTPWTGNWADPERRRWAMDVVVVYVRSTEYS